MSPAARQRSRAAETIASRSPWSKFGDAGIKVADPSGREHQRTDRSSRELVCPEAERIVAPPGLLLAVTHADACVSLLPV